MISTKDSFGSIFYYDYFSRFCLFVFFTEVYYNYYPRKGYYLIHELGAVLIPIEYWTGSNGASLCFQEKYMNESFDMDECCSELLHGKVSLEMDKSFSYLMIRKSSLS